MHLFQPHDDHLRTLFDVPHLSFVAAAMSAGNSPAKIWVDDASTPRSAFMWDKTHSLYFGGDASNTVFNADLRQLLAETIVPHGREHHLGIFKLYTASEAWAGQLGALLQIDALPSRERTLYALDKPIGDNPLPQGFRVAKIERELLDTHANGDRVLEEIGSCWNTLDLFFARGFGYCVLSDADEIAAWCTAEYVSDHTCGIGIETVEDFQRRGVATGAARVFAQHCDSIGWRAHWDAWSSNTPSVRVAEKAGFRKVLDYNIQICVLED